MRERLITALLSRVAQFRDQGDASALFDDAALDEASELEALMVRDGGSGQRIVSVEALDALVEFYLRRHGFRADSDSYADVGHAARLLLLKAELYPAEVPAGFYETVATLDQRADEARDKARRLYQEYERTRDIKTLDETVTYFRRALELSITGRDVPGLPLAQLAGVLGTRFLHTAQSHDLDEAIELRRLSIESTAKENPELSRRLTLLCGLLLSRYKHGGALTDLEQAVLAGRQAVAETQPGHRHRVSRMDRLASALLLRYERTDTLSDLDEAIELGLTAFEAASPEDPDLGRYTTTLRECLLTRYDLLGDTADLDTSVEIMERVLAEAPDTRRARFLTQLGAALYFRYERTGDPPDLDRAIRVQEEALAAFAERDDDRGHVLGNLAASYQVRYDMRRSPEDLEAAIRLGTEAVSAPEDNPFALSVLSMAFILRFKHTWEPADLDRAIRLATEAVAAYPPGSPGPHRAMAVSYLIQALLTRRQQSFGTEGLDEVITWAREAVAAAPRNHPDVGLHQSMLADLLLSRFRREESPADLKEAIENAEQAVAVTPKTHRWYGKLLGGLAEVLGVGAGVDVLEREESSDLDRAVALTREAVAAARGDDIGLSKALQSLVEALRHRYRRKLNPADPREAIRYCRQAADITVAMLPDRIKSCATWGRAAVALGDYVLAAEGYGRAVLLLPQLAWHGLSGRARENHLTEWSGLASAAAACCILAGEPERAVEILEQGRTIIQNQSLHTRGDLTDLEKKAPTLAADLMRVRELLDARQPFASTNVAQMHEDSPLSPLPRELFAQERAELCREWDDLVAQVRRLEGFERFLAPVPFEELRRAAGHGAVVIINVSEIACHALLLRDATAPIEVIDLPDLAQADVAGQVVAFLNVLLSRSEQRERPFLYREADRHAVHDVLDWLWDRIAGPVLDHLGPSDTADGLPPRVWWCPTGRLALLPLHAAGHHPRHRSASASAEAARVAGVRTVPDLVVSSYTPTLTALSRARDDQRQTPPFVGLLAIGMPETPGQPSLPGVERELDELHARLPKVSITPPLIGRRATREAVLQALDENSWVHFACHAEQNLMDASQSSFLLYDGRLTVAELHGLHLPHAELAYLSACDTAAGGVNVPDEAMHLAATMQLAGYRHVIATMWSIYDSSAPDVATAVYAALHRDGRPDARNAARALHNSVAALRLSDPTDPLRWAAYVHVGP
ncbi:CHAT domain-containing protein [Streptomyces lonegramiae]|uniref:CHAT domain-containing protein n=1 Tax=Streptomyces lonegramiae TaxID=3075524 RepID=A0ABU2XF08_9ACTN|nr:CHAT domain-containing protein [Streptomyces sp. DSM 41529]MDT0544508.1 CHAT domain-containing protein [Streptomyces sp. DSM 41529]